MGSASSEECKRVTEQAKALAEGGDRFRAIELLMDANKRLPRKMPILYLLSLYLLEISRYYDVPIYAKQFLELTQICDDTQNIARAYCILGDAERNIEHYDEAIKYYKLGQKNDFTAYEFPLGLAKCYQKQQKYEEALSNYKKAHTMARDEGKEDEIRSAMHDLEGRVPKLKEIKNHKDKAQYNSQRRKYEPAKVEFQKLFELVPDDFELKRDYFLFLVDLKKYSEAVEFGEKLIAEIEGLPDYFASGNYWPILYAVHEGLIDAYNNTWHFIKAFSSKSLTEYFRLLNSGRYESVFSKEKAINAFKNAYSNSPSRPEAILKLISYYDLQNDFSNAHRYVSKGLAIANKTHDDRLAREIYKLEAYIYESQKNRSELVNSYNNILKYCKNNQIRYQTHYDCARSLYFMKDYKRAESELELCMQLVSNGVEDTEDAGSLLITCKAKQNPFQYGKREDFI